MAARWWLWTITGATAVFLMLPLLIVVPISFSAGEYLQFPPPGWSLQWYSKFFNDSTWIGSAGMSLKVGFITTVCATVLGTMAALALARSRSRGSSAANLLLMTPLIVPVIIYGIGAYALSLELALDSTLWTLVVAHTVLALPFVIVNVAAPLRTLDRNLERAASSLGARPLTAFTTVTLPLIRPGMLAGALFAFITSFDEVVVAIFVSTPEAQTLPVKMWSDIRLEIDPTISAPATMLVVGTALILLLGGHMQRGRS